MWTKRRRFVSILLCAFFYLRIWLLLRRYPHESIYAFELHLAHIRQFFRKAWHIWFFHFVPRSANDAIDDLFTVQGFEYFEDLLDICWDALTATTAITFFWRWSWFSSVWSSSPGIRSSYRRSSGSDGWCGSRSGCRRSCRRSRRSRCHIQCVSITVWIVAWKFIRTEWRVYAIRHVFTDPASSLCARNGLACCIESLAWTFHKEQIRSIWFEWTKAPKWRILTRCVWRTWQLAMWIYSDFAWSTRSRCCICCWFECYVHAIWLISARLVSTARNSHTIWIYSCMVCRAMRHIRRGCCDYCRARGRQIQFCTTEPVVIVEKVRWIWTRTSLFVFDFYGRRRAHISIHFDAFVIFENEIKMITHAFRIITGRIWWTRFFCGRTYSNGAN